MGSIERFLDTIWLESGLSENTLAAYRGDLTSFEKWAAKKNIEILEAGRSQILEYLAFNVQVGLSPRSSSRRLSVLRRFYRYLFREGDIKIDPTTEIRSPAVGRSLPSLVSEEKIAKLLGIPSSKTALGKRDRAMLETMYSSGLRVSELVSLTINQLDLNTGLVRIMGKGGKERIVPLGDEAMFSLSVYLNEGRSQLLKKNATDEVFLTRRGTGMSRQAYWQLIKKYALLAGIDLDLSPHSLRHAFATHLINHGADLRSVQMLLGHSDLSTTQIYTHVAKARMQAIHRAHHPRG